MHDEFNTYRVRFQDGSYETIRAAELIDALQAATFLRESRCTHIGDVPRSKVEGYLTVCSVRQVSVVEHMGSKHDVLSE